MKVKITSPFTDLEADGEYIGNGLFQEGDEIDVSDVFQDNPSLGYDEIVVYFTHEALPGHRFVGRTG